MTGDMSTDVGHSEGRSLGGSRVSKKLDVKLVMYLQNSSVSHLEAPLSSVQCFYLTRGCCFVCC